MCKKYPIISLEDVLAEEILSGQYKAGDTIYLNLDADKKICFDRDKSKQEA